MNTGTGGTIKDIGMLAGWLRRHGRPGRLLQRHDLHGLALV